MARPQQISADDIKRTARQQMQALGTAGLTLRGIARALDVTAPAIYNYFPRLDDLITALIVDAFTALADAMERADAATPPAQYGVRLAGIMRAYRTTALDQPLDFQLIFGNAIPGYEAPRDITVPAATRAAAPFTRPIAEALLMGHCIPARLAPPPVTIPHLERLLAAIQLDVVIPSASLYYGMLAWSRAHGAILLEMHGHLLPVVGDGAAYYEHEIALLLSDLGF
jgi:AcrR family transcriptional regulator